MTERCRRDDESSADLGRHWRGERADFCTPVASTLSERIELLDEETRSCWARVEELEDEEASLRCRLAKLTRIRRSERMEVLRLEQACKTAEMAMLQAQQDSFDMEAMSQSSERSLRDDAAEGTAATTCTLEACSDVHENGDGNDLPPRSHSRSKGSNTLFAALGDVSAHDEKRRRLMSFLAERETHVRSEVAEAARSAAVARRSAKKRRAEILRLDSEVSVLREEPATLPREEEISARVGRAKHAGEGLQRRLDHARNKLTSLQHALTQGSARHLEEEEQRSLELMHSIAEAKARLRSRELQNMPSSDDASRTQRTAHPGPGLAGKLQLESTRSSSSRRI